MREDYDPFSPEVMADPIAAVSSRAREDPVFFSPAAGWWTVGRYEHVVAVLNDTKRFSSTAVIGQPAVTAEAHELAPEGDPMTDAGLINTDRPTHRRIRRVANQAFNPREINARASQIEALVGGLLDGLVPKRGCDIVAEFAMPLPIMVLAEVVGVPREDAHLVHLWSNALVDTRSSVDGERLTEAWHQIGAMTTYLDELIAERRRNPQDDYVTRLVQAKDGDEAMFDDRTVRALVAQLIPAGNETTRSLIAFLVLRLADDPGLAERLRENPELVAAAVQEELRHSSPAPGLLRVATEDVELGGVVIQEGDLVHVHWASASRDGAVFDQPDELRVDRKDLNKHVAFGRGEHFCLGAVLARLEAQIALRSILARLPNLRRANDEPRPQADSTANPRSLASFRAAASSDVLPIPAAPSTMSAAPVPAAARSSPASILSSSRSRPSNTTAASLPPAGAL